MAADSSEFWKSAIPSRPVRLLEDQLCARCHQARRLPGTRTVSLRLFELLDAVVTAAIALGNAQQPESIMHLGDEQRFLNACLDSLYFRLEKLEKRAGEDGETTTIRL